MSQTYIILNNLVWNWLVLSNTLLFNMTVKQFFFVGEEKLWPDVEFFATFPFNFMVKLMFVGGIIWLPSLSLLQATVITTLEADGDGKRGFRWDR